MTERPRKHFADMTSSEIAGLDFERTVAVLPVAAIEQHGPHLPLSVDATINRGIVERAMETLPDDLPATFLPAFEIGRSEEHQAFQGTLSIKPHSLAQAWTDIGESLHRSGFRKLLFFNSHGGQPQVMDLVARDLRVRLGMFVVMANWYDLGMPPLPFDAMELAHGVHGGAIETSMMLHLRPDLVRTDEIDNFVPAYLDDPDAERRLLGPHGPAAYAWATQDLNLSGAVGDARQANAEVGELLVTHAAENLVKLLREIRDFPLEQVRSTP